MTHVSPTTESPASDSAVASAAVPFDAEATRRDFPILSRPARGGNLVYLDSAATSQKPQAVIDAMVSYYTEGNANVHRSVHYLAERATLAYEAARERVAQFVNAPSSASVLWVRGTTEAVNLVATAWGNRNVQEGDRILLTEMEHHSNLVPWQMLAERTGAILRFVPVTDDGLLDLERAKELIAEQPKLFAFTAKSNVLGTANPVAELCRLARDAGTVTFIDGAQLLPHGPADFQALGCDFLAFSSHKMVGPMGIGNLIVRPEMYDHMDPYHGGGEMIARVKLEESTYKEPPLRYEAGTPSVGDTIGLHAALDYLAKLDAGAVHEHETHLTRLCLDLLAERGITTYGPNDASLRAGIVSFNVPGIHPHDVATLLDGSGVACRAGHHCCQPLMRRYNLSATVRASFYLYNTEADVHALVAGLDRVTEYFKR